MQILDDWRVVPAGLRGSCVALGNFDGVHLGHVHLLRAAHAARPDAPLAVLTFDPHPRTFFRPDDPPFRLTSATRRAELLAAQGVRLIYQLRFDAAFAALSADQFLAEVLAAGLAPRHLCCGPDFAFGYRRGGDVGRLATWSEGHGVGLTVVPPLADSQGQISSTRIRRLLQDGYPERAAAALGRPFSLRGVVAHGDARGRTLGFPTANIALGDTLEPARGVYAVRITALDGIFADRPGVANLGLRPTMGGTESRLEAHVLDWSGDLYGRTLDVALISYLRAERRFAGLAELTQQIAQDAAASRDQLG